MQQSSSLPLEEGFAIASQEWNELRSGLRLSCYILQPISEQDGDQFNLTFMIGLCVGCCYGDEFLTIVSEQPVLACRSTEELGQWKYNKTVSHFNTGGDSLVYFLVVSISR